MPKSKKFLKFYKKNEHKYILNEIFEQISKKQKKNTHGIKNFIILF